MFKKIASNTISQIFSKVFTAIISIFLISILTKYLSIEMYWQYNKIYNYLAIFWFLADLWLYTISIREISKDKSKAQKIIWNMMSLRLILWFIIILFSISIAFFLPWYNSETALISILIVWFFTVINLLNSSVLSLMQSFMKIEFSAFTFVLWKIINLLLIYIIVLLIYPKYATFNFDNSFILIMLAWLIWVIINFILNFYYANKIAKITLLFDFWYIKKLFIDSLPYWIALFLSVVYFRVDTVILSLMEVWSKWDLSIAMYSLPMKIIEVLMVIWVFFLNSLLPILSSYFKDNLFSEIKILLNNSFKFLFWFASLIIVLWLLFKKHLILVLATPDYLDKSINIYTSNDVFTIILFILLFYFISLIFNYIFIASNNEKILLYINLFITIFNIIWNIILIPKYSFVWAWIITLISQILLFWFWYYFSRKIIKLNLDIFYMIKIIIFSVIFYFLWNYIILNNSFGLYFDLIVYWSLFFIIFTWFLFFLNKKEILNIKKL